MSAAAPALGADRVYWTTLGIGFANLDGTGGGAIPFPNLDSFPNPRGVAIDAAANKIYWVNTTGTPPTRPFNTIWFANLNGSDEQQLNTDGAEVRGPLGLAVYPAANKIYWTNASTSTIDFANLNNTGHGGTLTTGGATVDVPQGLAIDPAANKIYWVNGTAAVGGPKIQFANLDGTGHGGTLNTGGAPLGVARGLAIDPPANKILWANYVNGGGTIGFANLDDTGHGGTLTTAGANMDGPQDVAIDPTTGKVYWGNVRTPPVISFANVDNSGGAGNLNVTGAPMGNPIHLALLVRPAGAGAPAVSGGGTTGATLSCSQGTWAADVLGAFFSRAPAGFSYEWTRDGATVSGATSNTLVASVAGEYACRVTARNYAGGDSQSSAAHTVSHVPVLGPDLALTKAASPGTVHPAGQVTYQLTVHNRGPGEARGVTLEDLAPFGVSFAHVVSSQGQCTINTDVRCALGSLGAGGGALVQVTATVAADASPGPVVNRATVWGNRGEANESNNTASSTVHVTAPPQPPQPVSELVLTKQVDRRVVSQGQQLRYTITVTNRGPDAAAGVRLTDTPALPLRVISIHPGQGHCRPGPPLTCELGTLRSGAHTTVTITAVATVTGAQVNAAAVMSDSRDPHPQSSVAAASTRIMPRLTPRPPPPRFTG